MTQKSTLLPQINPAYWGFMLGGLVRVPLMLSYADLLTQPAAELICTLGCAGNTTQPNFYQSLWRGVLLSTLLDQVTLLPYAEHAHIFAADGYRTSIPLDRLRNAALVYARDDRPLTPEAGFPVRLIAPGLYGYKMPKWIQRIELRPEPLIGTWEQRGWSTEGIVSTTAAITHPRHRATFEGRVTFAGTAFAGDRPITQIEISINDSAWMPVDFTAQPPQRLINWLIEWTPPTSGNYRVQARATDSAGITHVSTSIVVGMRT